MKKEITFVLTSCGKTDLLDKTLESFFKYNSYVGFLILLLAISDIFT